MPVSALGNIPMHANNGEEKKQIEKTWANFKTFFESEYQELREQQKLTTKGAGYHTANMVTESGKEIADALEHLAMAANPDKSTITLLTEANAKFVQTVAELSATIAKLTLTPSAKVTTPPGKNPPTRNWYANGYCWTHGFKVTVGHTSATCKSKGEVHQDESNRSNPKGGSTWNKNWKKT